MSQVPPPVAYQAQTFNDTDRTHLNVLAICYWVWGGMIALFSLFGIIYIITGVAFMSSGFPQPTTQTVNQPPPAFIGWLLIGMGALVVGLGQLIGWLTIYAGFSLKAERRWMLIIVMGAVNCLSVPIGTVLGVFTFIVLARPSVKARFASNRPYAS